jgi:hypothetical protein
MNSSNVTSIDSKQQQQAAATHVITYQLDGFSITTQIECSASSLLQLVGRLKEIGATPATSTIVDKPAPSPTAPPRCPAHNTEMKPGRRGFFCPKKTAGGEYCKEVA